ncbi:hypothetical protein L0337_07025 [candidate division KSB1 bacterium]|nr:hypothetical protein [candidate division KSB1 bacterium]
MRTESLPICRHFTTKVVFVIIAVLALFRLVWAQHLGTYGAPSLLFSPSAVASGFGSGSVAASTEASAIYYNPAALSRIGRVALEMNTFKLFPLVESDARYYTR